MGILDDFEADSGPGYRGVDGISSRADHAHRLSTANPVALGTAAPGTGKYPAREDHVHPLQTIPSRVYLGTQNLTVNPNLASLNAGFTDIPDANITFTAPAGAYVVDASFNFTATKAGVGYAYGGVFVICVDGSVVSQYNDFIVDTGGLRNFVRLAYHGTLAAGSRTIKIQVFGSTLTGFTTSGYNAIFDVLKVT